MNWLILAICCAFSFGLYNFFIKVASGSINQVAGAVILQVVAALCGLVLLIYIKLKNQEIEITSKGVLFSCLAGFFVGMAEILTFFVFGKGTPASVATPVIIGGSVAVAAILGILILKEQLTLVQGLGTVLIIGGVVLLSLNSGGH